MILQERMTFDQAGMVVESSAGENGNAKKLYMTGIFVQGGVRNHNQRIYPVREISSAVDAINGIITKGESVLGECDHPEELNINLDRVSHRISKMWMDGPNGMGKLEILPTPVGNIIKTLIECDVKLGVSSRGSGDVDNDGSVSGFEIVTVDIVARPSAPGAYPRPVYESRDSKRGAIIESLAHAVSHDPKAQTFLQKELMSWIEQLK